MGPPLVHVHALTDERFGRIPTGSHLFPCQSLIPLRLFLWILIREKLGVESDGFVVQGRKGVLVLLAARPCRLHRGESNARTGEEEEMRIADILREEEDEQCCSKSGGGGGGSSGRRWGRRRRKKKASSSCSSFQSPRCLLSRWLTSKQLLKCRTCGEEYGDEELVEEEEREERGEVGCLALGSTPAAAGGLTSSCSEAAVLSGGGEVALAGSEERKVTDSGRKPEQTCLNIGMGVGLLFLLTRSMTEFKKMTELRKEMEVLLKEAKEEMHSKNASSRSDESKNNLTFCGSDSWADSEQSNDLVMRDCNPCLELVETSCDTEPDGHSKYNEAYKETKSPRIDEIEAELVSELELLQLNLDKQDSSEQFRLEFSGEGSDPSESFSVSLGEHYEPKVQAEGQEEEEEEAEEAEEAEDTSDLYGICPHELTRRLHELLETRQQERIAELESALELAHSRLHEKEMEVRLWRDAAQLVSQNKELLP